MVDNGGRGEGLEDASSMRSQCTDNELKMVMGTDSIRARMMSACHVVLP